MKRLAAGVLAGLFLVLMCSSVLLAAPGIRVSINGQGKNYDPAPRIVDIGLQPLRFVVEDPAPSPRWSGTSEAGYGFVSSGLILILVRNGVCEWQGCLSMRRLVFTGSELYTGTLPGGNTWGLW